MKLKSLLAALAISSALAAPAAADTSLELLQGWHYNDDFNGDETRTTLTIKTFQWWKYGTFFMYYDITGPFTPFDAETSSSNEKAGFFGGTSVNFSIKRIGEAFSGSEWDWGPLVDLSVHTEVEHVSKFGALMYYGLQGDFKVPGFDFVSVLANARDDWALGGMDLQLGGAWQMTLPIANVTDIVFAGFFQWGVFGEGKGTFGDGTETEGNTFFITQPQLMFDAGQLAQLVDNKLYLGVELQYTINRYLIEDKSENLAQLMFKWNI